MLRSATSPPSRIVLMLMEPLDAETSKQCKLLGISIIMKPLRRQALLQVLGEERRVSPIRPSSAPPDFSNPDAGLRILLAEDNIVNQRLLCRILEKMGHRVVVAEDGSIALRRLADDEFDVIIMDMQMPVMDGIKTTEEIRLQERATGQHIPIMAITANAFDDDRRRCLESGMDGFVVNPVTRRPFKKKWPGCCYFPPLQKGKYRW
jgi:two-component system, sensor histidine kinase and response regulator